MCVHVCDCLVYSQRPQLRHVVEAGQGDEGDVVVVEGAGRRHRERKKGERREKQIVRKIGSRCHFLVWQFKL